MSIEELWAFLPLGYLATVGIEAPVLLLFLSRAHSVRRKLLAGFWLTACTYPIVVLFLPIVFENHRLIYLVVAEIFAPAAECLLFYLYCRQNPLLPQAVRWDYVVITLANLMSFITGLIWHKM